MKMVLYATNISKLTMSEYCESLDNIISARIKEKIGSFKFISDRKRTLCGELLVRYMIANKKQVANKEIILERDDNGKPYCKSFPGIHFNISHSDDWVIGAVCDSPIGVDIERVGCADLQIARRFFTEYEYQKLLNQETNRNELFYKLWTLKESYMKYTGKGLRLPLNSFEFDFTDCNIRLQIPERNMLHFKSVKVFKDYYLAVCSEEKPKVVEIKQVTFAEIRKVLLENKYKVRLGY